MQQLLRKIRWALDPNFESGNYWRKRYESGGNSGAGSYGRLATYKADYINGLIKTHDITSAVEWGCGDGNQTSMFEFSKYTGLDVSPLVIERANERFGDKPDWQFKTLPLDTPLIDSHDLSMSLDVVYHLTEDAVFDQYMRDLMAAAKRFVLIYASDFDGGNTAQHVRHRHFSAWISAHAPDFTLIDAPEHPYPAQTGANNPTDSSFASFKLFERKGAAA